jgi:DNA-binding MarR family transcriptional regulator
MLLAIKGLPLGEAPTVRTLAARLVLRHNTTVELAMRLEAAGFVKRTRDRADGRVVRVEITPRGDRVLKTLTLAHKQELVDNGRELIVALQKVVPK